MSGGHLVKIPARAAERIGKGAFTKEMGTAHLIYIGDLTGFCLRLTTPQI